MSVLPKPNGQALDDQSWAGFPPKDVVFVMENPYARGVENPYGGNVAKVVMSDSLSTKDGLE